MPRGPSWSDAEKTAAIALLMARINYVEIALLMGNRSPDTIKVFASRLRKRGILACP